MFHKVQCVEALADSKLKIEFADGTLKMYDISPLIQKYAPFQVLSDENLFRNVSVDTSGYGISWNDDVDLSCEELFEHGIVIHASHKK